MTVLDTFNCIVGQKTIIIVIGKNTKLFVNSKDNYGNCQFITLTINVDVAFSMFRKVSCA